MKSIIKSLSSLGLALGLCSAALAVPITGSVNFFGSFTASSQNFTTANLGFTFSGVTVVSGTGNLFSASSGGGVTINPITANVAGNGVTAGPVLWNTALPAVGGFVFTASSIFETTNTPTSIGLFAFGLISGPAGYETTAGTWEVTFQHAATGGGTVTSTFSSSAGVIVPDGGSTSVLLGIALLGLAWFAKRK